MKRLYLLRHGQTEFNVKKLVQGRCDSPLTDLGRKQAGMAAAWLKAHDVVPDKVVSSPLGRAMDTAQLVATELLGPDAAVESCEGIIERCYGSFEEGPHDALPTDVWDPGEDLVPFGGEGSKALQERMVATLTNLMGAEGIETLLAVSHGSANSSRLQPQRASSSQQNSPTAPSWSSILTMREKRTIRPNASSPCNKLWIPNKVISLNEQS